MKKVGILVLMVVVDAEVIEGSDVDADAFVATQAANAVKVTAHVRTRRLEGLAMLRNNPELITKARNQQYL